VDRHEGMSPWAGGVDRPRHDLLTGAALPGDEDFRIRPGHSLDLRFEFGDRATGADELYVAVLSDSRHSGGGKDCKTATVSAPRAAVGGIILRQRVLPRGSRNDGARSGSQKVPEEWT